jgi:hypothetical protein
MVTIALLLCVVAQPPSLESRVATVEKEVATIKWQTAAFKTQALWNDEANARIEKIEAEHKAMHSQLAELQRRTGMCNEIQQKLVEEFTPVVVGSRAGEAAGIRTYGADGKATSTTIGGVRFPVNPNGDIDVSQTCTVDPATGAVTCTPLQQQPPTYSTAPVYYSQPSYSAPVMRIQQPTQGRFFNGRGFFGRRGGGSCGPGGCG